MVYRNLVTLPVVLAVLGSTLVLIVSVLILLPLLLAGFLSQ